MDIAVNIGEEVKVLDTCYRNIELQDKQWVEFEQDKMPSRDSILDTFSKKFRNQTPWGEEELLDMSEEGKVGKAVQEALTKWYLNGTNFNLLREGKLRLHKDSQISRELKQTHQAVLKMANGSTYNGGVYKTNNRRNY